MGMSYEMVEELWEKLIDETSPKQRRESLFVDDDEQLDKKLMYVLNHATEAEATSFLTKVNSLLPGVADDMFAGLAEDLEEGAVEPNITGVRLGVMTMDGEEYTLYVKCDPENRLHSLLLFDKNHAPKDRVDIGSWKDLRTTAHALARYAQRWSE